MPPAPSSLCYSCLRLLRAKRRPPILRIFQPITTTPHRRPKRRFNDEELYKSFSDPEALRLLPPGVRPSSNLRIATSDMLELKNALDKRNFLRAYDLFTRLTSDGAPANSYSILSGTNQYDNILKSIIMLLLEGIIQDVGKTDGLPQPEVFIDRLRELGADNVDHYATLLIAFLREGKDPEKILPVFESAVDFFKKNSSLSERPMVWGKFSPPPIKKPSNILMSIYTIFLYLRDKDVSSPAILEIETFLESIDLPSIPTFNTFLNDQSLSPEITGRLTALAANALFKDIPLLRVTLNKLVSSKDVNLIKFLFSFAKLSPPLNETVYGLFITAFMSLRQNTLVFDCWETMTLAGVIPGLQSWNALLVGAGKDRDKSMVLKIWSYMEQSGLTPDAVCWTTRIHALLNGNMVEEGLMSLNQMQKAGITPTVTTINAALDGLLKYSHLTEARQILAFAESLSIVPDRITYNTLLETLLKTGKFSEALSVIADMEKIGISPDIITFTVVIDGLYKYSSEPPPLSTIINLFEIMANEGIEPNITTYTTLIDGLLSSGNEPAVEAILTIMRQKKIAGTVMTYTVLIRYRFRVGDLEAVDKIWEEVEKIKLAPDTVLWTETIFGYANAGQTSKMRLLMGKMLKAEGKMGLKGWTSVIIALGRRREYGEIINVVDEVLTRGLVGLPGESVKGPGRGEGGGSRGGIAEREFWEAVSRLAEGRVWRDLRMKYGGQVS